MPSEKDKKLDVSEAEKTFLTKLKAEREIMARTIKDIVENRSMNQEEIPHVNHVPLLTDGVTLEDINADEVGMVLFVIDGEQVISKCKNVDDYDISQYTGVFVTDPSTSLGIPEVIRGSSHQSVINDILAQPDTSPLRQFTLYTVLTGTGDDEYTDVNTNLYAYDYHRWDLLIEDNDAVISFALANGTSWGGNITLLTGMHSIDFTSRGIRIRNRTAGSNCTYEIEPYR